MLCGVTYGCARRAPFAAALLLTAAMATMGPQVAVAQEKAPPPPVPEATAPVPPAVPQPDARPPDDRWQAAPPGCPFNERKLELIV